MGTPLLPGNGYTQLWVYRPDVVELMHDYLEGYRGTYVAYQVDVSHYVLLTNLDNASISESVIQADGATVYQIDIMNAVPRDVQRFTGSSGVGSLSGRVIEDSCLSAFTYQVDQLHVSNTYQSVIYSSEVGFPHLIEGSELYAYSEIMLVACACVFVLVDLIFRRVYR